MVIISDNIQTQLQTLVELYVDYRTKGEYGISAFWYWYYQVMNYLRNMDSIKLKKGINKNYRMPQWGMVRYTKIVISKDIIVYADEFTYNRKNLYNWLQHKSLNRIPYSVCDTCFGFSSVLYDNSQKYGILKPDRKPLVKPVFDDIINFHHSYENYNIIHAIGFIGNRVYEILQDGTIKVLHISKQDYLDQKHRYDESKKRILHYLLENNQHKKHKTMKQRIRLTEGQLHNIIRKCVNKAFKSQKLQQMYNDNGGIDTKGDVLPYNAYNGYAPRLSELTDDMIDDEVGDFYDERMKNATTHNYIRFKNGKYAFLKPNAMSGDDSTNVWKQREDRANAKRNSSLNWNEYDTAQNPELKQLYTQRKNFKNSANKLEQDYQNRRVSDDFYRNNKKRNSEINQSLNDRWNNAKMNHGM